MLPLVASWYSLFPSSMVAETLPEGVLSGLPWRRANVKYTTNEIYLDMIEELDGALDGVTGQLQVNSHSLTG